MRPGLATTDLLHPDPRQVRAPVRACTPDGCVGGQLCVRACPALSRDKLCNATESVPARSSVVY